MSGEISVADLVRNTTFNSFGSARQASGSSAQGFAGLSLRGLGEGRTLKLIDGRRVPTSAQVGQGQDLNSIPLGAVERIEILSDGASAIYGSDAIGGVINIITRKDFDGVQSEQSDQYSFGFAYHPTDWLNMTLDYWNIEVNNRVTAVSVSTMINCLSANPTTICPPGLSNLDSNTLPPVVNAGLGIARSANGSIAYAQRGFVNLGSIEGNGIDLNVRSNLDFDEWGSLNSILQVSYTL